MGTSQTPPGAPPRQCIQRSTCGVPACARARDAASILAAALVIPAGAADNDSPGVLPETLIEVSKHSLSVPFTEIVISRDALVRAPARSLDGALKGVPGFRLFRRTDSAAAHPTAQGVSLGGVGPSGASRSVVLMDGVPMNDPFGGWVSWNRFHPLNLSDVHILPLGGVSPYGNASLGGVISLDSRFLNAPPFACVQVTAGNLLKHLAEIAFAEDTASGGTRLFGGVQETDFSGYPVIRRGQRGPVDIRSSSREQAFDAGVRQALAPGNEYHLTLRSQGWQEERQNGTPYTTNSSSALDLSLRFSRDAGPKEWTTETVLFAQARRFESRFSTIAPDRNSEKPSLDQFSVPARSAGLIQRLSLPLGESHVLGAGLDFRTAEGTTHERFKWAGNAFSQIREAGGKQSDTGAYVQDVWSPLPSLKLRAASRADWHRETNGHLLESDIASGAILQSRSNPRRDSFTPSWTASADWSPREFFEASAAAFQGARNPTLNELYRPYRTGDTLTLANPGLRKESITGGELAVRLTPTPPWRLHFKAFASELRDAISNIGLVRGPGNFGDWGFLGSGVSGARRENVEKVAVRGVQTGTSYQIWHGVTVSADWLATHSEVRRCRIQPALEGRSLPQIPGQQASFEVRGEHTVWFWTLTARYYGRQYDDDSNLYTLAGYTCIDAGITRKLGAHTEVSLSAENLTNSEIQTRREPSGIISTGAPLSWSLRLKREF